MDPSEVKGCMVTSLFSSSGSMPDQTYISHLKIWEEVPGEATMKPRYIIIARDNYTGVKIHKSKENSNRTFSVGKTWSINELRGVEVISATQLRITFARSYTWNTEASRDQGIWVSAAIEQFRRALGSTSALQLINVTTDYNSSQTTYTNGYATPQSSSSPRPAARSLAGSSTNRLTPSESAPAVSYSPNESQFATVSRSRSNATIPTSASAPSNGRDPSPRRREPVPPLTNGRSPRGSPAPINGVNGTSPRPQVRSMASDYADQAMSPTPSSRSRPSVASVPERIASPPPRRGSPLNGLPERIASPPLQRPPPSVRQMQSFSATDYGDRSATSSPAPTIPQRGVSPAPGSVDLSVPSSSRSRVPSNAPRLPVAQQQRPPAAKDPDARISMFDAANQATADRLLSEQPVSSTTLDDESLEVTMANVEEMLEGYEWSGGGAMSAVPGRSRGAADQIEARLLDELLALDRANIHSFLETDDRIATVLKFIDDAIADLNGMESQITSYKIQLNGASDDIAHIQSQNRGLQVQTQNQRRLLTELEKLMQTVHVDTDVLYILSQESLKNTDSGIERLEFAAAELYKALQAGRDNDMAATMERLDEYRTHNSQFCTRLLDFLPIMFKFQADSILSASNKGRPAKGPPSMSPHTPMYRFLKQYARLVQYLKEMDEQKYSKLCAAYFSEASNLHQTEVKELMLAYIGKVKKASEEETETNFTQAPNAGTSRSETLRRVGTKIRSPLERREKKSVSSVEGDMLASEAFQLLLDQVAPQLVAEQDFISDFLHINEAGVTFADCMNLDSYFRRQASRSSALGAATVKLMRSSMDLIFGFLAQEFKDWIDGALQRDALEIVGILAAIDQFSSDDSQLGNHFLQKVLQRQQQRLRGILERQINDQVKAIDQTKLTTKKRTGVAQFVKYFPIFVSRVEAQLIGADLLEVRGIIDTAYEKLVQSMLDCLKQMAKLDGEGEDKGQLNYHIILIDNMFYFTRELSQQQLGAVSAYVRQAESIYDENLAAYVKLVLRRPLGKILDFFDGVERIVQTTGASGVTSNSNYNKSSLKRVVKDYNGKDMRRNIEALFKRVDKHFNEDDSDAFSHGTAAMSVWKALEDEMTRSTERFSRLISQCYPDSGGLEYQIQDIEAAFRKHRMSS